MFYQFNQTMGLQFFTSALATQPVLLQVLKRKDLGEAAMKWLLAIHDVRSMYQSKYLDEHERTVAVNKDYFRKSKVEWEDDELMIEAANVFREHFYDSSFIQLQVIELQIRRLTDLLRETKDIAEIKKTLIELKELAALKVAVQDDLKEKLRTGLFDNIKFKNGRKPSMLTKIMEEMKDKERGFDNA
jgi:hypothetical protein